MLMGQGLGALLSHSPPVLEPDLDLPLSQAQGVGDLDPSSPGQVPVEVELLLQLQGLVARVGGPLPLRLSVGVHSTCKRGESGGRV